jgi:hypothetical protein
VLVGRDDGVDLIVGAGRVVVVEHDPGHPGLDREADGVLGGGVAEEGLGRELGRRVLGVVEEDVGAAGQVQRVGPPRWAGGRQN